MEIFSRSHYAIMRQIRKTLHSSTGSFVIPSTNLKVKDKQLKLTLQMPLTARALTIGRAGKKQCL